MHKKILSVLLLLFSFSAHAFTLDSTGSTQFLVVTTADWNAITGQVTLWEKTEAGYQKVGSPIPVVVGNHGMAWGVGISPKQEGVQKIEGDHRAPAGVFALEQAMGYASKGLTNWKMPYRAITPETQCIEDQTSNYYNTVPEPEIYKQIPLPWKSSEKMLRKDILYKWLVVVGHNTAEKIPGSGSCVFFHIWREPTKGTLGCTATSEENITKIISWLDPVKKPLLVQMPQKEYERLKSEWGLP